LLASAIPRVDSMQYLSMGQINEIFFVVLGGLYRNGPFSP